MTPGTSTPMDVLAFGPHPDDVEIFCGGTLIHLAELGHAVAVVDLTRGELSTHGTVEQRAEESQAASKILGLTHRENLGLPDGFLSPWSKDESSAESSPLGRVVEAIRRLRPEIVLAPWIEERHPDPVAHFRTNAFGPAHAFEGLR
jgi:N-acetylglucosamine malate deacetylase 1